MNKKLEFVIDRQGTPAAMWRVNGGADPFDQRYNCPLSDLAMGDTESNVLAMMLGLCSSNFHGDIEHFVNRMGYILACKDRIRWLSRRLYENESEIVRESNDVKRSQLLFGNYGDDAVAYALAVDGNDEIKGYDVCSAAKQRIYWLALKLRDYDVQC